MLLNYFKKLIIKRIISFLVLFITPFFLFADLIDRHLKQPAPKKNKITDKETCGWDTKELIKEFQAMNEGVNEYLIAAYKDEKLANDVTKNAMVQYKALVIELPDVGGKLNHDSQFINVAAWYLAYYRAMKPFNKTPEDVGRMIYQLNKIQWKHYPKEKAKLSCTAFFSETGRNSLKKWCEWTQKRQYPANWIAEYVPGNGEDFDFGYNYNHCGVCMYLYAYNAIELAPFICTNDFLKSSALGTGLERTKTIATGDGICNFRFKKNREVKQNWDTEIKKIRNCLKNGKLYHP